MRIERIVSLPCSVDRAWVLLTDWERQAIWMRDADRVTVVSRHREGTGVRLAVRTRILGIPAFTEPIEVLAWDPPHRLVIGHGGPVVGTGTWSLVPHGEGTLFTWAEDIRLAVPLLGRGLAWCYRPVMGVLMRRALADLRGEVARG